MIILHCLGTNPKCRDFPNVTSYKHQKQVRPKGLRLSTWGQGKGSMKSPRAYQNLLVL